MQFDTDLGTLRRQHSPWYTQQQFWWTAIPILITLGLATAAITLRITTPNAVRSFMPWIVNPCFELKSMLKQAGLLAAACNRQQGRHHANQAMLCLPVRCLTLTLA